jgi:hypothetical protein
VWEESGVRSQESGGIKKKERKKERKKEEEKKKEISPLPPASCSLPLLRTST